MNAKSSCRQGKLCVDMSFILQCHDISTHITVDKSTTQRCQRTRFSGRCSAVSSEQASQALFMALIIQHGLYMLSRVLGAVCDWVWFASLILCQPWDMGLVRNCFQVVVQHLLEGLSCASRGISDVLRQKIEQPGTLDRKGGLFMAESRLTGP